MSAVPAIRPGAWPEVALSDVAELLRGVSYPKTDARDDPSPDHVPVLRATNIQDGRLVLDTDLVYIAAKNISDEQRLHQGDIVVATSSGSKHLVGKSALLRHSWSGSFGAFCAALRPKASINPRYLAAYLQSPSYRRQISKKALGVNINNLRRGDLEILSLPLPPLAAQEGIVAEIEKQFSRLDEAVANLKRVKANLKRYKAAVLKAAVEGRLVQTEAELARREGRSYETGAQLLQRILETRRSQWKGKAKYKEPSLLTIADLPELPEGWLWATWDQIGFSQNGRAFPSSDYANDGVKLLRPGNLYEGGHIEWNQKNTRLMPKRYEAENADLVVRGREIVMNLTAQSLKDEFLGRVCLTDGNEHCLLNQRLARLTPIKVEAEFVLVVFKSTLFRRFVDSLNTGSLIQHMFTSQLAKFYFPLPPLAEQRRIVGEVDRLFSVIDAVNPVQADSLTRAVRMRDCIIQRFFSGT